MCVRSEIREEELLVGVADKVCTCSCSFMKLI